MTNATFTITSVEDKGTQIKIKDERGNSWSFFKIKKDGQPTKAWQQFQTMKVGETTGVGYNETPNTKYGGVFRNIVNFTPPNYSNMGQTPPPAPIAPPSPKYEATNDFKPRNFKREGYEKCLWGYWLEMSSKGVLAGRNADELTQVEMDLVWQVFNQIEKDADIRFSTGWAKAEAIFGSDEPLVTNYPEVQ
jgi:hypothetical protein